jgi:hypothetical protein
MPTIASVNGMPDPIKGGGAENEDEQGKKSIV